MLIAMKPVSIAEAKNRLPALVHKAARHPIEITRRGKPVAVLVSRADWDRARGVTGGSLARLEAFRARHDLVSLELANAFEGLRVDAAPRKFRW
jgi:prevent-host-death family protein